MWVNSHQTVDDHGGVLHIHLGGQGELLELQENKKLREM
jgi:hypothetical protein